MKYLRKTKKIILFIVEGITDEISLGLILSKLIEKDKIVRFKVINGDITAKNGVTLSNIYVKIANYIKEFISRDIYTKSDILKVVHIVDMDGVYITDDLILEKKIESIEYTTQNIYARNVDHIRNRNKQKSQILSKLSSTNMVYTNLPYSVYFFSSNIEHVMHNQQTVLSYQKRRYAEDLVDKFIASPVSFIEFINNKEFALALPYKDTWDFIKKDTNSLKRYTNFNLFINTIKTK